MRELARVLVLVLEAAILPLWARLEPAPLAPLASSASTASTAEAVDVAAASATTSALRGHSNPICPRSLLRRQRV